MDDKKLKQAQFEAMLELAVNENHNRKMSEIPPQDELEKAYSLSPQHERRMRTLFTKTRRADAVKKLRKLSFRAAAVLIITAYLIFGALMLHAEVRGVVTRVIVESFDSFTRFRYVGDPAPNANTIWQPSYLPSGFSWQGISYNTPMKGFGYVDDEGSVIRFHFAPAGTVSMTVGTSHSLGYITSIDNIDYHIFDFTDWDSNVSIFWEKDGFFFTLEAQLDVDELLKIAQSVKR